MSFIQVHGKNLQLQVLNTMSYCNCEDQFLEILGKLVLWSEIQILQIFGGKKLTFVYFSAIFSPLTYSKNERKNDNEHTFES